MSVDTEPLTCRTSQAFVRLRITFQLKIAWRDGRTHGPTTKVTYRIMCTQLDRPSANISISSVQLTPAPTDFKGLTIIICYRRISVIANIENKEKIFRISVTCGSDKAGFNCIYLIILLNIKVLQNNPLLLSFFTVPVTVLSPTGTSDIN